MLVDKVLYRLDNKRKDHLRLCVPQSMCEELLAEAHAGLFPGMSVIHTFQREILVGWNVL